ncbi:MAG: hypothetical protein J7518_04045 [Nocardioidaceae bacterium]|nr:hypothetical protein [Nocardioidaceae bacterium]
MTLLETPPPAGGAAFHEILYAGAIAGVVIGFVGWVVLRERLDKPTFVSRFADWCASWSGLPRWVALPSGLLVGSILLAGFGVWWDVPIHMQNGRDPGPLANPSHYPIFLGILGFTHAGILGIGLARDPLPRRTVRLAPSWRVPMGALVVTAAGAIALVGFPADDFWHRIFGQDVTEWGPTHVMMIGGAVTCILGVPLLLAEAAQVGARAMQGLPGRLLGAAALSACVIPVAFLMEFDLGVPQFPAVTQFVIMGFVATWVFVAVRLWFGPGGALLAGASYLVIHAFLYLTILPLPGVLTARFLLMLPSAVLVELVALLVPPQRRRVPFAVLSGALLGSLGLYGEWLWSKVFMPLPQPLPASALPLMLSAGTLAAIGGGLLATWHVARLEDVADPNPPVPAAVPRQRWLGLAGVGVFVVLMAVFAPPRAGGDDISAGVALDKACDGETRCLAHVTVTLDPADAADDAIWFYSLSWQGRGQATSDAGIPRDPEQDAPGIMRVKLEETGAPGQYRTAQAVPLYGNWKTMLRLHLAPSTMLAVPLYAPDDPAIKGAQGRQVLVHDGDTVRPVLERKFLQRETKDDVPASLYALGYALVIAAWLSLLLFYGWCYNQAAAAAGSPTREKVTV